jgi:tRNA wybutosine-synthesizing protein 3
MFQLVPSLKSTQNDKIISWTDMPRDCFTQRKDATIKRAFSECGTEGHADKSPKGSVDEHIRPVCDLINQHAHFYTTSSCSGRIVIWDNGTQQWTKTSHELVGDDDVALWMDDALARIEEKYLKMEPVILHVQCRDIPSANALCRLVIDAGFRNSGITMNGEMMRIQLAVRSTLKMDVPLIGGRMSHEAILDLLGNANRKLAQNFVEIQRLHSALLSSTLFDGLSYSSGES